MNFIKKNVFGIILTVIIAIFSTFIGELIPQKVVGAGVFALLIGMLVNPVSSKYDFFKSGISFVSKRILRTAIVFMGLTLSFSQVLNVGKYSLIVMFFTLTTAFGGGYLIGKMFGMNWKLSGLISAGTGICGGSAIAAIAPVIEAEDRDIAYAISATFIFDVLMVILFPIAGKFFGMSDLGYGLWAGTAVNDTSSVVAAGYAFSDAAGSFAVIVKLTRTLSIIPTVLIFSIINQRLRTKNDAKIALNDSKNAKNEPKINENRSKNAKKNINFKQLFPYFILIFLIMVLIKSTGFIPNEICDIISKISKFLMVMSLGAIGLKTNFKEVAHSGFKPMIHGFLISSLVVVISFLVQMFLGQM